MPHAEMKNAPPLYGWAIAVAAGAVATGVSLLLVGIEGNGSVGIGVVIALVVGIIFTIAEKPPAAARTSAPSVPAPAPTPAPVAPAPQSAAPAAAAAPQAAPAASASAAPAASAEAEAGTKPAALSAPQGTADDLKQIAGVGPVIEGKLNDLGIYHFWQIARWSGEEISWVDGFLNFKGRIERDDWVTQARDLAKASPATPPAT